MLKIGQTYFKNLRVFSTQDLKSLFGYISANQMTGFCIKCNTELEKVKFKVNKTNKKTNKTIDVILMSNS